jgi:hypothetical protein
MRFVRWLLSFFTRRRQPADPMISGLLPDTPLPSDPPRDPYSSVRHPRRHAPSGKSASVAVEEPDDEDLLCVVGGSREHYAYK